MPQALRRPLLIIIGLIIVALIITGIILAIFHVGLFAGNSSNPQTVGQTTAPPSNSSATSPSTVTPPASSSTAQNAPAAQPAATTPSTGPTDVTVIMFTALMLAVITYTGVRLATAKIQR